MVALRLISLVLVVNIVTLVTADEMGNGYDCNEDPGSLLYRGDLSKTWSNHTCRSWTDKLAIAYEVTAENFPDRGLGDHNHCRHPNPEGVAAWCFTEDIGAFWQHCEIGMFHPDCRKYSDDPKECYVTSGADDYRGRVNVTRGGIPCQKWSVQKPNKHIFTPDAYPAAGLGDHNYCRNPEPYRFYAWCYTTNAQTEWDFCNIGLPSLSCGGDCGRDD